MRSLSDIRKFKALKIQERILENQVVTEAKSLFDQYDINDFIVVGVTNEIDRLNYRLSDLFTGKNSSVTDRWGKTWRKGDKIIITQNISMDLMRGFMGRILDVYSDHIVVSFENNIFSLWTHYLCDHCTRFINLGWVLQIHQVYGYEWNHVIGYISPFNSGLSHDVVHAMKVRGKNVKMIPDII